MRLLIVAVGKLKDVEERAIVARYAKRLDVIGRGQGLGPLDIVELSESRAATAEVRKADEGERVLKAAAAADFKIALDVLGTALDSEAFARHLGRAADAGAKTCALLIGGPDGHAASVLDQAQFKLSLGAMTLPHGLARVVLAEQLYRAATILARHPYHRAG
ncbi:MAG: 23S rRNA (pseudouridine(1915)-N(3))-methyltransferase RlmH [Hyphomicrobium sp.]